MRYPIIEHHGAKDGVTGSCHQLHMNASTSVLIDCGLFQGNDASLPGGSDADRLAIEFPLDTVKALIVTHVHIDHVGRIPCRRAVGLDGGGLCCEHTAKLLPIVLEGTYKLNLSRDYAQTEKYIRLVELRFSILLYKHWLSWSELLTRMQLRRAGYSPRLSDTQAPESGVQGDLMHEGRACRDRPFRPVIEQASAGCFLTPAFAIRCSQELLQDPEES